MAEHTPIQIFPDSNITVNLPEHPMRVLFQMTPLLEQQARRGVLHRLLPLHVPSANLCGVLLCRLDELSPGLWLMPDMAPKGGLSDEQTSC